MGLLLHTRIPRASSVPVPRDPPPSSASGQILEARGPSAAQDRPSLFTQLSGHVVACSLFSALNCPQGVRRVGHVAGQAPHSTTLSFQYQVLPRSWAQRSGPVYQMHCFLLHVRRITQELRRGF